MNQGWEVGQGVSGVSVAGTTPPHLSIAPILAPVPTYWHQGIFRGHWHIHCGSPTAWNSMSPFMVAVKHAAMRVKCIKPVHQACGLGPKKTNYKLCIISLLSLPTSHPSKWKDYEYHLTSLQKGVFLPVLYFSPLRSNQLLSQWRRTNDCIKNYEPFGINCHRRDRRDIMYIESNSQTVKAPC